MTSIIMVMITAVVVYLLTKYRIEKANKQSEDLLNKKYEDMVESKNLIQHSLIYQYESERETLNKLLSSSYDIIDKINNNKSKIYFTEESNNLYNDIKFQSYPKETAYQDDSTDILKIYIERVIDFNGDVDSIVENLITFTSFGKHMHPGRSSIYLCGLIKVLSYLKDSGEIQLNIDTIYDYLNFYKTRSLISRSDIPLNIRETLIGYVFNLPDYEDGLENKNIKNSTIEQHNYLAHVFKSMTERKRMALDGIYY